MAQSSSIAVLDVPILTTKDVEKLELESKFRLKKVLDRFEAEKDAKHEDETVEWLDSRRREIFDSEKRGRVKDSESIEILIDPAKPTELMTVPCLSLPHSYQKIRNSLWIEKQPVYKAALVEWQSNLELYSSKVERKTWRVESLKNGIFNMIGFYSVFQGVLVTASSQSSVLHCRNVGLPIALSVCASIVTLFGILQMFSKIHELDSSIFVERIQYKVCSDSMISLVQRSCPGN